MIEVVIVGGTVRSADGLIVGGRGELTFDVTEFD